MFGGGTGGERARDKLLSSSPSAAPTLLARRCGIGAPVLVARRLLALHRQLSSDVSTCNFLQYSNI